MIHDLILALLNPSVDTVPMSEFLVSPESCQFMHPSEHKMLMKIIKIATYHQEIINFVLLHSSMCSEKNRILLDASNFADEPLSRGLYLQAFCEAIDLVLCPYRDALADLENRYLKKPKPTLMFIFESISKFELLLTFLLGFLSDIRAQRLHGCALLQYLQQNSLHGNSNIMDAIEIIQRSVHRVFLKQLSQWILFGQFVDENNEFFIQMIELQSKSGGHNSTFDNSHSAAEHTSGSVRRQMRGGNPFESIGSSQAHMDLWRYEINLNQLPQFFSLAWAEKVRFIGQTVVMFNENPSDQTKDAISWPLEETDTTDGSDNQCRGSLWNNRQQFYANKLNAIIDSKSIHIDQYDPVVDEIKNYVSERLSVIAIKQADLVKQLLLIKDFYLLGRGELFLEFIKQSKTVLNTQCITVDVARVIVKAFKGAAHNINVTDDAEQFALSVPVESLDSSQTTGFIQSISLKYKVRWPLHLLFSPQIIDGYNELFRFLLNIKRIQFELHSVWCDHREKKMAKNSQLLQLRNKFMFLVDNLQYYLQADVLESQFSILMETVQDSRDFEQIQRAHTVFQANILRLCFLLSSTEHTVAANRTELFIGCVDNPVLHILNQIMMRVMMFCELSATCSDPMTKSEEKALESCDLMFSNHVSDLMKLLVGLNAGPSSAPLAQLLLRLDYNYWFSSQQVENNSLLQEEH